MRARKATTIICGLWASIVFILYLVSMEMTPSALPPGQIKVPQEADRSQEFNKQPPGQQTEGQVQQQQPETPAPAKDEKKEETAKVPIPPPVQQPSEGLDDVIDIALIIQGPKNATRAETMIKSLLYYQGRFQSNTSLCKPPLSEQTKPVCNKSISSQAAPLHFYVLADKEAQQLVNESAVKFQRKSIEWTLYHLEDYVPNSTLSSSASSPLPLSYLLAILPDILPKAVHKVLCLDPDLLFNRDVSTLWNHFKNFATNQSLGTVWIPRKKTPLVTPGNDNQTEFTSFHAGVVLMDVDKLRLWNWTAVWKASAASRPTLDEVFKWLREIFYRLPCDWNAGLEDEGLAEYCLLVWPEIAHNIEDCITNNGNFRLVHIAHSGDTIRTDGVQTGDLPAIGMLSVEEKLTVQQLRERFQHNYQSFARISPTCFQ
ncbi:unnamed protein product [Calicophoron daubneyi]|uniref:Uncharacterized protein n=1 Tax=Calicophoron daubneyi TaxID=300641 RepID=A0AAV2TD29_CALDB